MKPHKIPHYLKIKIIRQQSIVKIPGDIKEILYLGRLIGMLNKVYQEVYENIGSVVNIKDGIGFMDKADLLIQELTKVVSHLCERTSYYSSYYFYEPRVKDYKLILMPKKLRGIGILEDLYRLTSLIKGHSELNTINLLLSKIDEFCIRFEDLVIYGYEILGRKSAYYPNRYMQILHHNIKANSEGRPSYGNTKVANI